MFISTSSLPNSWLGFELNVLRRLKFKTVALPTGGESTLGANLKRWNIRVLANDFLHSDWIKSSAAIENNNFTLTAETVSNMLENVYVPGFRLQNPSLLKWFREIDAWWFDNLRRNIEKLESAIAKSVALKIGMSVGDYALSFDTETLELRQPLSNIFRKFCSLEPNPFDNNQSNACANKKINDFIAENYTDLMFLRLPLPRRLSFKTSLGRAAWREEWIHSNDGFWENSEVLQLNQFAARVETKTQYLQLLENILQTASHIPAWAIAHAENSFISTQEIIETISRVRRVETIFTKDFSELAGTKAVIITA